MDDRILASFLEQQYKEAMELAAKSDLLELLPLGPEPYQLYLLRYSCKGLVRTDAGVGECDRHELLVRFPDDYLRHIDLPTVFTWRSPVNAFHPAIRYPFICPGTVSPGHSFVEILYQCHDIIRWRNVNMDEDDCLNRDAAAWARAHQDRFPIDSRTLVRRRWNVQVQDSHVSESNDAASEPRQDAI